MHFAFSLGDSLQFLSARLLFGPHASHAPHTAQCTHPGSLQSLSARLLSGLPPAVHRLASFVRGWFTLLGGKMERDAHPHSGQRR